MFDYFVAAQETTEGMDLIGASIDVGEILGYAGEILGQVWPLLALAIGVPLAFYIAKRVKGLIA